MKKIKIIIIISLSLIAIISTVIIIIASSNKNINEAYHTILENKSYIYKENRKMVFNIYSDTKETLIENSNDNKYVLNLKSFNFELDNVSVKKYEIPNSTLLKIEADIPYINKSIASDSAKLIIHTMKNTVTLRLGSISILNPTEYNLLSIGRLYGSYCKVDGYKQLVGINIKFNKDITISELKIGEYAYGNLKQMTNENYDNEINILDVIPNYNIYMVEKTSNINVAAGTYFIPINYLTLNLIREGYITLKINNEDYYLDCFTFMSNDLSYDDYKDIMKDGEIS